jgi:hypothetical protein
MGNFQRYSCLAFIFQQMAIIIFGVFRIAFKSIHSFVPIESARDYAAMAITNKTIPLESRNSIHSSSQSLLGLSF